MKQSCNQGFIAKAEHVHEVSKLTGEVNRLSREKARLCLNSGRSYSWGLAEVGVQTDTPLTQWVESEEDEGTASEDSRR